MIVKNEAHVIRRCLASVRPIIDRWVIVDTGSTDGTQAIVREAMSGVRGALVERAWRDFAHNRSEALELARPHATYSIVIDADDELVLAPGFALPELTADSYTVDILYGETAYRRPQIVRNTLAWRYRGVLHEFLDCSEAKSQDHLPLIIKVNHEGARSSDPETYAKDAMVLEQALAVESDPFLNARYTFYLAQSYRDSGQSEQALTNYLARAKLGFWIEEVFVSLLRAGRLMEALGHDVDETLAVYRRASATCPTRAEAAHAASHLLRLREQFAEGAAVAMPALGLQVPPDGLFVERWIYAYGLRDEYAVNAYWAGQYRECLSTCLDLLERADLPDGMRPRVAANARFAADRLMPATPEATPSPPSTDHQNATDVRRGDKPADVHARVAYKRCPLCESASIRASRTVNATAHARFKRGLPETMEWVDCDRCGHQFTSGYFDEAALARLFEETNAGQVTGENFEAARYTSARMVQKVARHVSSGLWLDVGFGNGSLLFTAAEFGFQAVGLDMRPQSVEKLKQLGYEAYCKDVADFEYGPRFDVVSMADVLEHMPFPKRGLAAARDLTRVGSVLLISMPNTDAPIWKMWGDGNPYWIELEHYHNFGRARLYELLREHGFDPVSYGVSERYRGCMEVIAVRR